MKGIAAILSSETEPFVPSFSDFDVDEPKMITYYACLLRQRYGGPLPKEQHAELSASEE